MLEQINEWLHAKAGILSAAGVGALMSAAVAWRNPLMALRQMMAGVGVGYFFGPVLYSGVELWTPFNGEETRSAAVCAAGICGLWVVEGLLLASRRWSRNPTLPPGVPR